MYAEGSYAPMESVSTEQTNHCVKMVENETRGTDVAESVTHRIPNFVCARTTFIAGTANLLPQSRRCENGKS